MGNIRSIVNALEHLGVPCRVSSSAEDILQSDKIILPGVGSFFTAMRNLQSMNLIYSLNQVALQKKIPILGICLGMQLLAESGSENGTTDGLGWIPGHVRRIQFENLSHRIPHTGFNSVQFSSHQSALYTSLGEQADFYFVHSYHIDCDERYVSGSVDYNGRVIASVENGNVYGTQFHPEKSQSNGLIVLRNFSQLT